MTDGLNIWENSYSYMARSAKNSACFFTDLRVFSSISTYTFCPWTLSFENTIPYPIKFCRKWSGASLNRSQFILLRTSTSPLITSSYPIILVRAHTFYKSLISGMLSSSSSNFDAINRHTTGNTSCFILSNILSSWSRMSKYTTAKCVVKILYFSFSPISKIQSTKPLLV